MLFNIWKVHWDRTSGYGMLKINRSSIYVLDICVGGEIHMFVLVNIRCMCSGDIYKNSCVSHVACLIIVDW